MKIAFFDTKPYDIVGFKDLGEEMGIKIKFYEERLTEDTAHLAKGYDGTCSFVNDNLNDKAIEILKGVGVKVILLRCAGFDSVDLDKAKELDIPVLRVPSYSPEAVAEHAVALLQTINRKTHLGYNRTKNFNFSINGLIGTNLRGKTLGIIGTGKIGKEMIRIMTGFGMNIIAYDVYKDNTSNINYVELDELYERSDVISLHLPLLPDTKHMINKESIAKMKDGVLLVNTSRGGLIKTIDLIEALKEGKFNGVGLDVYENEKGLFFEDKSYLTHKDKLLEKLLSFHQVVLTGHQAFFTNEAIEAIASTTLNNFKSYIINNETNNQAIDIFK